MSEASQYSKGDKVLCYHGPLLYEAKILKLRHQKKNSSRETMYWVHYRGWKKKWDEWVGGSRIVSMDEPGLALAKCLREGHSGTKKRDKSIGLKQPKSSDVKNGMPLEDHIGFTSTNVLLEGTGTKLQLKIKRQDHRPIGKESKAKIADGDKISRRSTSQPMNEKIRTLLATEWEFITKRHYIYLLPPIITIRSLLKSYMALEDASNQTTKVFCENITTLFNSSLPRNLLYRIERLQYLKYASLKSAPVDYYGAEHLARLILKLPLLLADVLLDDEAPPDIQKEFIGQVDRLSKFLADNFDSLFQTELVPASGAYLTEAKSF